MMLSHRFVLSRQKLATDIVSVLLEPKPGSTDDDVIALLNELNLGAGEVLSEGFIAARVPRNTLPQLESVAFVHVKPQKQLRLV
jgi:hypothetical protein